MPDSRHFALFLVAAFLLAVTPGPGIFYVLARSLGGGRREGVMSAIGTFIGGTFHVLAAALGLSAILVASATALHVVKYAGTAYLVYLGARMVLSRNAPVEEEISNGPSQGALKQGILTEVLNPKTALFFLSFIPQFVSSDRGHLFAQFLLLGSISVGLNTAADLAVAFFAGPIGQRLRDSVRFRRRQRTASGIAMIGLGAYVAAADSR